LFYGHEARSELFFIFYWNSLTWHLHMKFAICKSDYWVCMHGSNTCNYFVLKGFPVNEITGF
jgi:hypothetical protein